MVVATANGLTSATASQLPGNAMPNWYLPFTGTSTIFCGPHEGPAQGCGHNVRWDNEAIDFALNSGTPLYAIAPGRVVYSSGGPNASCLPWSPANEFGYGNLIVIEHSPTQFSGGGNVYSYYAHLNDRSVAVGQVISSPQTVIGHVGQSGCAKGPHLHLSVRISTPPGSAVNLGIVWWWGVGYNVQNLPTIDWRPGCPGTTCTTADGTAQGTPSSQRAWSTTVQPCPSPGLILTPPGLILPPGTATITWGIVNPLSTVFGFKWKLQQTGQQGFGIWFPNENGSVSTNAVLGLNTMTLSWIGLNNLPCPSVSAWVFVL
jgi:murein DD-endopeptidase MepM/ murein hydrolase activator NlpD